jgi:hypothetical protein
MDVARKSRGLSANILMDRLRRQHIKQRIHVGTGAADALARTICDGRHQKKTQLTQQGTALLQEEKSTATTN